MTDLTDKLRTCAAYILGRAKEDDPWAVEFVSYDTADLLIEASNVLDMVSEPLGEPMEILEPIPPPSSNELKSGADWIKPLAYPPGSPPQGVWTTNAGDLPPVPTGPPSKRPPRVCPQCDSRAVKRVIREGSQLFLSCPVCAATWNYQP